jgi:hypothetical protein
MRLRFRLFCLFCALLVVTPACGGEDRSCDVWAWAIAVTDDPAPLTDESGEPVARLDVRATGRCRPSIFIDEVEVWFDRPRVGDATGKTTHAVWPENTLLMELVDQNGDDRLGVHDALLLSEGPLAVVPPGVEWEIGLMKRDEDGSGASGMASANVLIE